MEVMENPLSLRNCVRFILFLDSWMLILTNWQHNILTSNRFRSERVTKTEICESFKLTKLDRESRLFGLKQVILISYTECISDLDKTVVKVFRSVFLNRWVEGIHIWVAKNWIIVVFYTIWVAKLCCILFLGRQLQTVESHWFRWLFLDHFSCYQCNFGRLSH